jgi:hypothetical protein
MLDILVWAAVKKIRVSDDRLSRLLYTDDDEESEMRQSKSKIPTGLWLLNPAQLTLSDNSITS